MGNKPTSHPNTRKRSLDNSVTELDPKLQNQFLELITPQEIEMNLLTKVNLLTVLSELKKHTQGKYFELKQAQREEREEFMQRHAEWGNTYALLCSSLKESFNRLVIRQTATLEESVQKLSQELLELVGVTKELFEASILHYAQDAAVVQAMEEVNLRMKASPSVSNLTEILEICRFRSSLYEELSCAVKHPVSHSKHLIIKTLVSDETMKNFGLEDEDVIWAIATMNVDEDDPIIEEFKLLKYLY